MHVKLCDEVLCLYFSLKALARGCSRMIALRSVARKSRALAPRATTVASVRTHLHFKFEAEEAPESLGETTKLNMCNAIKNAMGKAFEI